MSILCGTDFSPHAVQAANVAAALARRLGLPLDLLHVDEAGTDAAGAARRLAEEAARLRATGVDVREHVRTGAPDEALASEAERAGARLLVVGSLGRRSADRWRLGASAERTVVLARCPVLITRDLESLTAWAEQQRPLRVVVGVDLSAQSDAAVGWLGDLARILPCEITLVHVFWSPGDHHRMRIDGPLDLAELHPEVERRLERDLHERFDPLLNSATARVVIRPGFGRPADHLVEAAQREHADLLVVGTHQRTGLSKLWHGSISFDVLHLARSAVACVPAQHGTAVPASIHPLRQVLVPTDISAASLRAFPYAYGMVANGGIVHLFYVAEAQAPEADPEARMREWIPGEARARGIETRIHVVSAVTVAEAVVHHAEQLQVDAICMATHGRSGVSRAMLGSVAQSVFNATRKPVFLVRGWE